MMKKITLLILLFTIPFIGFAQTYDFTDSDDGWDILGGFNAANNATFYTLTTKDGNGTLKNPTVAISIAGVDTSVNSFVGITLRNNDATGPDFLRVSYPNVGGGRHYEFQDITTNDSEFVTYWFDLSNAVNWVGTMDDIKLHFKTANGSNGGADYVLPNNPNNVSIDIDKIEFAASAPTTLQESYTFDTDDDTEGFSATAGSISSTIGGILTFMPNGTGFSKLNQLDHHVDATTNKYIRITLKNNSALNNQLRFVFPKAGGGNSTTTQEITVGDAAEVTYYFDLSANVDWTGDLVFTIGIGSLDGGKSKDNGTVEFNSILINATTLSVNDVDFKDDVSITLFPNPVSELMAIHSPKIIERVAVYNLLGQLEMSKKGNVKELNISNLSTGMYIIKIHQEDNQVSTKRFVKE